MYDIAITGIGIVSSIGTGTTRVAESLKNGRSGLRVDPLREKLGFRSSYTGVIDDFIPPKLNRKKSKTLPDFGMMGYAATLEAIEMAGWQEADYRSPRTGLIIGNDSSTVANYRQVDQTLREKRTIALGSGLIVQAMNSTVSMNLNTLFGIQGASWTLSSACASGSNAIGQGSDLIALGRQDRMICGGVQEITWESVASFDATNAFSINAEGPEAASRPFDRDRDGLVPSGGAAIVLLERYDLAKERGAEILGMVHSYAFSSDGNHLTMPTGEGLQRCMTESLELAKINPEQISYINAHATSTPKGDIAEANAIAAVFGDCKPWVSSQKSMVGHEMWMAGASQVAYSMLMIRDGFIAQNLNYENPDPEMPPLRIATETIPEKPSWILCNAAGFGGTNTSLVVGPAK